MKFDLTDLVRESVKYQFSCSRFVILVPDWMAVKKAVWNHLASINVKIVHRNINTKKKLIDVCIRHDVQFDFSQYVKAKTDHGHCKRIKNRDPREAEDGNQSAEELILKILSMEAREFTKLQHWWQSNVQINKHCVFSSGTSGPYSIDSAPSTPTTRSTPSTPTTMSTSTSAATTPPSSSSTPHMLAINAAHQPPNMAPLSLRSALFSQPSYPAMHQPVDSVPSSGNTTAFQPLHMSSRAPGFEPHEFQSTCQSDIPSTPPQSTSSICLSPTLPGYFSPTLGPSKDSFSPLPAFIYQLPQDASEPAQPNIVRIHNSFSSQRGSPAFQMGISAQLGSHPRPKTSATAPGPSVGHSHHPDTREVPMPSQSPTTPLMNSPLSVARGFSISPMRMRLPPSCARDPSEVSACRSAIRQADSDSRAGVYRGGPFDSQYEKEVMLDRDDEIDWRNVRMPDSVPAEEDVPHQHQSLTDYTANLHGHNNMQEEWINPYRMSSVVNMKHYQDRRRSLGPQSMFELSPFGTDGH